MNSIALVTPPYHSGVVECAGTWPNVGFVYMAGALREAGFSPVVYDAMTLNHELETIGAELVRLAPDVIATSAYTSSYPAAVRMLRMAKELLPGVTTVIGGVHAHFMYEEVLTRDGDAVDFVVRGEGEQTLPALISCIKDGSELSSVQGIAYRDGDAVVATASRQFMHSLDNMPAAWDLVDWGIYQFYPLPDSHLAIVSSSRGCDQACSFCSQQVFWQRSWRARSPEDFVDELQMLKERYGVGVMMLSDETPTLDRERWERILDLLIERELDLHLLMETRVDDILRDEDIMPKYYAAGVRHIYVGVERTDQATLDLFKKNTKVEMGKRALDLINSNGIISETSMVLGLPDDTEETIEATLKLLQHYNPDLGFFLTIAPWPYADMYEDLKPYIESYDYEDYNLIAPVVKPTSMSTNELERRIIDCYRRFYMGKLTQVPSMTKEKRDYFIITMRLLMENSYLKQHMGGLGSMPAEVKNLLQGMIGKSA
jgi:anaerobic magnesium-protoporphyrin IX monomethyl ester cyclase